MESDRILADEALAAFGRPGAAASAAHSPGRATVVAADDSAAASAAAALAGEIARAPAQDGAPPDEAAFDRLGPAARSAQALLRSGKILAAALTCAGRGRIVGPLRADLLLRHGVSRWR